MKFSYTKGYKYKLREDERTAIPGIPDERAWNKYISLDHGFLIIRYAYLWDGSTIPLKKFIKRISFGRIDFDRYCKIASLVHDAFCQLMREGLLDKKYKEYVDGLYRDMIIEYVEKLYKNAKTKKQKRIAKRRLKRVKLEANLRYWFLRKFGDRGIQKQKNPRNKIFEI